MDLTTGGILAWLAVGLIAGWAAGKIRRGNDFGLIGDLAVALIGALVGGLVAGLAIQGPSGFSVSVAAAFVGAAGLLALMRLLGTRRMPV